MKQIEYRVWDKVNKVMHYSKMERHSDYICYSFKLKGESPIAIEHYEHMLHIGISDKTGKKFYRGDIVHVKFYKGYMRGKIEELDSIVSGRLILHMLDYEGAYGIETAGYIEFVDLRFLLAFEDKEVIGNIHENPELLEGYEKDGEQALGNE